MQKILGRKRPELGPWTWEASLAKPWPPGLRLSNSASAEP